MRSKVNSRKFCIITTGHLTSWCRYRFLILCLLNISPIHESHIIQTLKKTKTSLLNSVYCLFRVLLNSVNHCLNCKYGRRPKNLTTWQSIRQLTAIKISQKSYYRYNSPVLFLIWVKKSRVKCYQVQYNTAVSITEQATAAHGGHVLQTSAICYEIPELIGQFIKRCKHI